MMKTRSRSSATPGTRSRRKRKHESEDEETEQEQEESPADDEDDEEDEEESSSEEEVVFNITERRKRATAGKQEKSFAGKAKEDHEMFWNDNNFAEEEDDSEISFGGMSSDEENLWEDSEDSDISRSDEEDIDAEDDAALDEANKEALAADAPQRKNHKGGFGKYKDPRFKREREAGAPQTRKSAKKKKRGLSPPMIERQMRASTQVRSMLAREAQTERLAEQEDRRKKNKVERDKRYADQVQITHEQRILNMEITEKENVVDLKRLLAAQMDNVYKEKKDPYEGPTIKWVSSAKSTGVVTVKDDDGNEVEEEQFEARECLRFQNEDPKEPIELFCEDDPRWEQLPTEKERVKYSRSPVKAR